MPYEKASLSSVIDIPRGGPATLLLDYDGTLVPIAATPDLAEPDGELLKLLAAVSKRPHLDIHIVSGRRRETIDVWFGHLPVSLWAEHGFWRRAATGGGWRAAGAVPLDVLKRALLILERFTKATPGSFIEQKTASAAWHYRLVDPILALGQSRALQVVLEEALKETPFDVLQGKKVLEVRLRGVNKGLVARRILKEGDRIAAVLAVGDDQTDEDLFQALPESAVTVAVGAGPTSARHTVEDHHAARKLIRALIN
jgi:trehalose 6-phosphate synthase/phosphatase